MSEGQYPVAGGGSQTLAQVLARGADANGVEITDAHDPTAAQSVATRNYVDTHAGAAVTHAVSQTAHGFTVGELVRYNGTQYVLAEADVAADADVDGIVSAVADANDFTIQIAGYVTGLAGLAAGTDYFLSPTTPGALTAVEPSTAGQVSKPVFHADSATTGFLLNMRGLVIPSAAVTYKEVKLNADNAAAGVAVGEGLFGYVIPSDLNGLSLLAVYATCTIAATGSGLSFGVRRQRAGASVEMLSTNVTIDVNKLSSGSSAAPPVIKSDGSQQVATDDIVWIDCDQADSNGVSRGADLRLGFG